MPWLSDSAGHASDRNGRVFLVSEAALDQAEEACLADSELRALRRERDVERRVAPSKIRILSPTWRGRFRGSFTGCPFAEARTIAKHTARRDSGRVGRTAAGRSLEQEALTLSVVAHIRHPSHPVRSASDERLLSPGANH